MDSPSFFAVIPATVRYHKDVSQGAKLLYGEVSALCNKHGYCWATNEYFAELYDKAERTIQRWIRELEKAGFVRSNMEPGPNGTARKIFLLNFQQQQEFIHQKTGGDKNVRGDKNVIPGVTKMSGRGDKNVTHNNTSNNTSNNTDIVVFEKNDLPPPPEKRIHPTDPVEKEKKDSAQKKEKNQDKGFSEIDVEDLGELENSIQPVPPKETKQVKIQNKKTDPRNVNTEERRQIIKYLNEKTGKNFRPDTRQTARMINGRLSEGHTLEDFRTVIDRKCRKWRGDPRMDDYLRPNTLFRPGNFENYLNEKDIKNDTRTRTKKKQRINTADAERFRKDNPGPGNRILV